MYTIIWNHIIRYTNSVILTFLFDTPNSSPHTGIRLNNYNTWLSRLLSKLTLQCDCVSGVQCGWSVTYSYTQVCWLKGASVVLPCTYFYSEVGTYKGGEWYKEKRGRVREHSNSDYPDCSLKIDKLSDDHSGVYHFRFYTTLHWSWITGRSGVSVSVIRNNEHIQLTIYFLFSDHNGNYIQG